MQRITFLTFSLFVVIVLLVIYILYNSALINQYGILSNYKPKTYAKQEHVILLWTNFFDVPNWGLPAKTVGADYFERQKCPHTNCVVTSDRDYLSSVSDYDAVLFHGAEPFPIIKPVPSERSADQLYVFALQESPAETKHNLKTDYDFFNLTMSYRLDSDIKWYYNSIKDKQSGAAIAPNIKPNWRPVEDMTEDEIAEWMPLVQNKTKLSAWFVSRCNVLADRMKLAIQLRQHINIDIFGKCGNFSCPRGSPVCDTILDENYKFYFAFENSLCKDYVTEKLFNALKRKLVPVVFGGADYTRFAPPKSYINAEDFETIKDLADYLLHLDRNPTEYIKYLWWRKYYKVEMDNQTGFCQLCSVLNQHNRKHKMQIYSDIEDWWLGDTCRLNPKLKEIQ